MEALCAISVCVYEDKSLVVTGFVVLHFHSGENLSKHCCCVQWCHRMLWFWSLWMNKNPFAWKLSGPFVLVTSLSTQDLRLIILKYGFESEGCGMDICVQTSVCNRTEIFCTNRKWDILWIAFKRETWWKSQETPVITSHVMFLHYSLAYVAMEKATQVQR